MKHSCALYENIETMKKQVNAWQQDAVIDWQFANYKVRIKLKNAARQS